MSNKFPNVSQHCPSEHLIQYSEAGMQSAETFCSLLYPFSKSAERTHYNCVFQVHIPYICQLCSQKEGNIRGHPGGKPLVTDHHIRRCAFQLQYCRKGQTPLIQGNIKSHSLYIHELIKDGIVGSVADQHEKKTLLLSYKSFHQLFFICSHVSVHSYPQLCFY